MAGPFCIDCSYYVNNGVAHCNNPKVARAVEIIVGTAPVHEMQIHFIRFTDDFCGIKGRWYEERD
jgi:hypothetical protein